MPTNKLQVKKSSKGEIQIAILDERYKTMSEDINTLKGDTKEIKKGLETLTQTVSGLPGELTKVFDERYASKKAEKALERINWIVVTGVVGALLALVVTG